jgi:microcystin degradation protein MlrC
MTRKSVRFASRPVRAALAIKIAFGFLAADVSLAAAKAVWAKGHDAAIARTLAARTAAETAILAQDSKTEVCREVLVEVDEGYGVTGRVSRWVCRAAL